eukprot:3239588-Amphidinium_carterae.1
MENRPLSMLRSSHTTPVQQQQQREQQQRRQQQQQQHYTCGVEMCCVVVLGAVLHNSLEPFQWQGILAQKSVPEAWSSACWSAAE